MTRQIAPEALIALDFLGLPFHDSFHGQAVDSRWRPQQPGPASASGQGRGRDESQSGRWLPSAASWLFRVVDVGLSAHGIGGTAAHQRVQRGNSAPRSAPAVAASLESGPDHPDQGDGGRERVMRGPSPSLRSCASTRAGPRSGTSATVCRASPRTTPTPTCTPRTPTPTRSSHTWQPTADRATALPTDSVIAHIRWAIRTSVRVPASWCSRLAASHRQVHAAGCTCHAWPHGRGGALYPPPVLGRSVCLPM
jgi:hypothetical protein